jgi:hypothetical protein
MQRAESQQGTVPSQLACEGAQSPVAPQTPRLHTPEQQSRAEAQDFPCSVQAIEPVLDDWLDWLDE